MLSDYEPHKNTYTHSKKMVLNCTKSGSLACNHRGTTLIFVIWFYV